MIVLAYSTLAPETGCKPIRFDDRNNPTHARRPLADVLDRMTEAFNRPSDCVWIVPGTESPDFDRPRTVTLSYNCRVPQGHRFSKDIVREWPEDATLGDVMTELTTELQSLGCKDITVTKAPRR